MARKVSLIVSLLALGAAGGCKVYHALPLDRQAKAAALQAPDREHLRIEAQRLRHPLLEPLAIDPRAGLGPEQAAVLAVLANPDLRAIRDQRALASAQLLEAGLLPDPVLSYAQEVPVTGSEAGAGTGHSLQLSLDLTSLLTRAGRRRAARAEQASVDLDVAWQEWQVAEAAKLSVYRLATLEPQLKAAQELVAALAENLQALEPAAAAGDLTLGEAVLGRLALEAGRREALGLEQARDRERRALNALLGLPPREPLALADPPREQDWTALPSERELLAGLDRRLDLVALEKGYESEDAKVRLAVWSQFPSIGLSLGRSQDTSGVVTRSTGVAVSLPFLNGGRGLVAVENATRRQLYDQYLARLHHARSDLVQALADLEAVRGMIAISRAALPELTAQARASEILFREGKLDLPSRNLARMALLAQKGTLAALQRNLDELGVALELASGRTLSHPSKELRP